MNSESAMIPHAQLGQGTNSGCTSAAQPKHVSEDHAERVTRCFKENRAQIVHWLEAKTGSLACARDIADEAFVTLLELPHPELIRDVRAYVYKVASNLMARWAGTAANHWDICQRIAFVDEQNDLSPEPLVCKQQHVLRVQQSLESLPPRVRFAVTLRFWDELPYAEITARLRAKGIIVTDRTVKRWVAEGLARCRQDMDSRIEGIDP